MHRVAMLLELTADEADRVVRAISDTDVRFAGVALSDVISMALQVGPELPADATIVHDLASDGVLYEGGPRFKIVQR